MAEAAKVRLVRCPKCENVLPVLENYSVYQCGGCGAVLRENQTLESDVPSAKSDPERKTAGLEDMAAANMTGSSDAEVKSGPSFLMSGGTVNKKNGMAYGENGITKLQYNLGRQDLGDALNADAKVEDGDHSSIVGPSDTHMSRPVLDLQASREKAASFQDHHPQNHISNSRFSTSQCPHEGPSCTRPRSFSLSQEMPIKRSNGVEREKRVQFLENDRAELLRKLDKLKDKITQSCDMSANPREKASSIRRTFSSESYKNPCACVPNGYPVCASSAFPGCQTHASPCLSQYQDLSPCKPNPFPAYRGPSSSQIHRIAEEKCHMPQYDPYDPRSHLCSDTEKIDPFPCPACSCSHTYRKHHENFLPIQSAAFGKNQLPDVRKNHFLYNQEYSSLFGSHYHNMRSSVPAHAFSHEPGRHTRLTSSINSVMRGSFVHFPRGGMALASGGFARVRAIAGGAPIISCCNCFELLQVPSKLFSMPKDQQKIKCGACSAVINYKTVGKKLVFPQTAMGLEGFVHSRSRTIKGTDYFSSDDFDKSGYEYHTMDRVPVKPSRNNNASLSNSLETESQPSSPSMANDENNPLGAKSLQGPFRTTHSPPPPGSPLEEHFDYSNNHVEDRYSKGNKSSRSEHEKVFPCKTNMWQKNSLNEASLATELEVSYNDYCNTCESQDSGDGRKEEYLPRLTKGSGESFFATFIKKSFKDFSRSNQAAENGKTSVSVNGYPLPTRIIKRAEKFAGPIHPGNYWYDSRAGFWGLIGGPCLGIIPPGIEEFNHPMLENCAAGNTKVIVNGRELHKEDLDLLSTRGLPTDRNRSYIIDISGRVWDEDTGEELDCLGKLAPTVEKLKHGFGMKAPKAAVC
ncbi:hypothetical protein SAY87_001504 [Trapa incisa]|uniref:Zinc-ribbon domain-containing protein n=1 Tax=Trapa incisa TaxID=236973 RepID=A0AAN7GG86_9MYRT|nr:hypothetical protein SAY87_001504 [Trapa incisa]